MKTKEEIKSLAHKNWEEVQIHFKDGLNPYAHEVGFVEGYTLAQSQFRQEWIPVEVRLPDEGRDVYTTVMFNEEKPFVVTSFIRHGNTKRWAHNHGFVTAWQYIKYPQPYNPTKS